MWKVIEHTVGALTWIFRAFLLFICFAKIYYADYIAAILFLFVFGLSLIPVFINQVYSTKIHWLFDFMWVYIIAFHMSGFLGMYDIWPIWDDIGHIGSALIIAVFGFFLAYSYDYVKHIRVTMPIIALFTILWTMGFGAIWEIIEFVWDVMVTMSGILTATGQYTYSQNGLFDTMIDLTWDLVSSVMAVIVSIIFVKKAKKKTLESIINPLFQVIKGKKATS